MTQQRSARDGIAAAPPPLPPACAHARQALADFRAAADAARQAYASCYFSRAHSQQRFIIMRRGERMPAPPDAESRRKKPRRHTPPTPCTQDNTISVIRFSADKPRFHAAPRRRRCEGRPREAVSRRLTAARTTMRKERQLPPRRLRFSAERGGRRA